MQSEVRAIEGNEVQRLQAEPVAGMDLARTLAAFEAHLNKSGKICPKPWYWRRFCNLFKPADEPPWLSTWWETSMQEKKALFLKQMRYLADHTGHFPIAYRFVSELRDENWYICR